jgi:hypothetical protein
MKPLSRLFIGAAAICALLVPAATASAQTVLLKDDAEGAIEDNWLLNEPPSGIEPWQKSDSSTPKYRPNAFHDGAASYWAGQSPPYDPVNVVEGESILTTKTPILVPADGKTTIAFWSLFQNEGDDQGLVEAAVATDGKPTWKRVAAVKLTPNSAGGPYVRNYCDPTHPAEMAQEEFEEIKGDLGAYAGKKVLLRWNLKYGNENRSATQPCGWWVDDIAVTTTGTPGNAGAAPTTPPPAGPPTPAATKPTVKVGGYASKGKKGTLSLTISGSAIKNAKLTLLSGKRKLGTAKAAQLAPGSRKVKFKTSKKLPRKNKKPYTVKITGTASDGSAFKFTGKTHDR